MPMAHYAWHGLLIAMRHEQDMGHGLLIAVCVGKGYSLATARRPLTHPLTKPLTPPLTAPLMVLIASNPAMCSVPTAAVRCRATPARRAAFEESLDQGQPTAAREAANGPLATVTRAKVGLSVPSEVVSGGL